MLGCVFKQKDKTETQIKKTDTTATAFATHPTKMNKKGRRERGSEGGIRKKERK